jgi:RNA polymerase sigma-70 factor (ECF subfamily)
MTSLHSVRWASKATVGTGEERPSGCEYAWPPAEERRIDKSPDSTLVRLARQGSLAARDALIRRYEDRVYTIASGYVYDPAEAQEITQETLLRMVEGLPRFREQASFCTWLYRIVLERCNDRGRRRSRYPASPSFQAFVKERPVARAGARPVLSPPEAQEAQELGEQIRAAIASIPELCRMAVILADIEGLSQTEIAEILRCPVRLVKSRLHQGRMEIRQQLKAYLTGDEAKGAEPPGVG